MNFPFPKWTLTQNKKRLNKAEQATARLRFIVNHLANLHGPDATYVALAKALEIHHTNLNASIKRGSFSPAVAASIEKHFGSEVIVADYLINPNSIK